MYMDSREKEKNEIFSLYFEERMLAKDIAKKLDVSNGKITYVIQQHPDYEKEKERRKEETRQRRREYKREAERVRRQDMKAAGGIDTVYARMMRLQSMNARSMSTVGTVNNSYVANFSPYKYDGKKHMVFDEDEFGARPNDLPERICVQVRHA